MGKRGPGAKPFEIRLAEGSVNVTTHGRKTDHVRFSKPEEMEPPDTLGEYGKAFWNLYYSEFVEKGVIQNTDVDSFETLCITNISSSIQVTRKQSIKKNHKRYGFVV